MTVLESMALSGKAIPVDLPRRVHWLGDENVGATVTQFALDPVVLFLFF
jgi:hypothetical protein